MNLDVDDDRRVVKLLVLSAENSEGTSRGGSPSENSEGTWDVKGLLRRYWGENIHVKIAFEWHGYYFVEREWMKSWGASKS